MLMQQGGTQETKQPVTLPGIPLYLYAVCLSMQQQVMLC
jgi:hypothetical protein